MKTNKDVANATKKISKKLIDKLAKGLAYLALLVFASYGLRELLSKFSHSLAYIFTAGVILLLVYVIIKE